MEARAAALCMVLASICPEDGGGWHTRRALAWLGLCLGVRRSPLLAWCALVEPLLIKDLEPFIVIEQLALEDPLGRLLRVAAGHTRL